jgi:antitoxin (DNA-binding transcriptional repressor) of toxin-antitoxin stability system
MEAFQVSELKARFSDILSRVKQGEKIGILYGRNKRLIAVISPCEEKKRPERDIGILEGRAKVKFAENYKMTEEDFLRS